MRVTYDAKADAAYIYFGSDAVSVDQTVPVEMPDELRGTIVTLDWNNGRLVGLEVLDASALLPADLLDSAQKLR